MTITTMQALVDIEIGETITVGDDASNVFTRTADGFHSALADVTLTPDAFTHDIDRRRIAAGLRVEQGSRFYTDNTGYAYVALRSLGDDRWTWWRTTRTGNSNYGIVDGTLSEIDTGLRVLGDTWATDALLRVIGPALGTEHQARVQAEEQVLTLQREARERVLADTPRVAQIDAGAVEDWLRRMHEEGNANQDDIETIMDEWGLGPVRQDIERTVGVTVNGTSRVGISDSTIESLIGGGAQIEDTTHYTDVCWTMETSITFTDNPTECVCEEVDYDMVNTRLRELGVDMDDLASFEFEREGCGSEDCEY